MRARGGLINSRFGNKIGQATSMLQLELAAKALRLCKEIALPVSQFAGKMCGNHKKVIDLARELQVRGLLVRTTKRRGQRETAMPAPHDTPWRTVHRTV